jgi:hypothetical protein
VIAALNKSQRRESQSGDFWPRIADRINPLFLERTLNSRCETTAWKSLKRSKPLPEENLNRSDWSRGKLKPN